MVGFARNLVAPNGARQAAQSPVRRTQPPPGDYRLNRLAVRAFRGPGNQLPKGVDDAYIRGAINHLSSIDMHAARLLEFKRMYTDKAHPFFLDFKKFGTASGPRGYSSIAQTEYFSIAAGKVVIGSPFEASGNLFYGFIGSSVGITNDELVAAAWLVQEGRSGPYDKYVRNFIRDSPQDVPHVNLGIKLAANYNSKLIPVMSISPPPSRPSAK